MRSLLHSESRLESLAAPGAVLSPDKLVEAIRGAMSDGVYAVKSWDIELLTRHAALTLGRVRYRTGVGGFTDESRVWLTSERDGLIWRMRIFNDRESAIDCLEKPGLGLRL